MSRPGRRRDDAGSAVIELVWVGILLMVPLLWIVLSVFEVQSGAYAVTSAARAAGRAYALAPDDGQGRERATAAARQALADQGLPDDAPLQVTVTCTPYPQDCHSGTSVITVQIESSVDLLIPDVLGGGRPSFALDATHAVPIGQYQEIAR
ncbi:hypothetical protein [Nocardioides sp. W7]|uniref:hypothetical protein n=1 Tax=Nocardioides sp. W7 TaxID=2931390 RepID=UPI001FD13ECB|nr:hypothetical protein [Nocardioides sp. W7]